MATSPLPSAVANHDDESDLRKMNDDQLTEGNRTSDLPSKSIIVAIGGITRICSHRRHEECVCTECLHFEYLV